MDLWQSLSGMVEVSITCADPAGIITGLRDDTMRLPTVESERGDHHDRLES